MSEYCHCRKIIAECCLMGCNINPVGQSAYNYQIREVLSKISYNLPADFPAAGG